MIPITAETIGGIGKTTPRHTMRLGAGGPGKRPAFDTTAAKANSKPNHAAQLRWRGADCAGSVVGVIWESSLANRRLRYTLCMLAPYALRGEERRGGRD